MLALLVAQNIAFYIIAALMVVGAIRVVTCKNLMHAALWLVLVLAGAAAQYILLASEFVAITQVLVYLGAIIVLFLFGIMLTRARTGADEDLDNSSTAKMIAAGIGVLLLGLLGYSLVDGSGTPSSGTSWCSAPRRSVIPSSPRTSSPSRCSRCSSSLRSSAPS